MGSGGAGGGTRGRSEASEGRKEGETGSRCVQRGRMEISIGWDVGQSCRSVCLLVRDRERERVLDLARSLLSSGERLSLQPIALHHSLLSLCAPRA